MASYPATPSNPYRRMKDLETDLKGSGLPLLAPSKKKQRAQRRKEQQDDKTEADQ